MSIKIVQAWVNDIEEYQVFLNEALVATFPDRDSAVIHMKELVTAKLNEND